MLGLIHVAVQVFRKHTSTGNLSSPWWFAGYAEMIYGYRCRDADANKVASRHRANARRLVFQSGVRQIHPGRVLSRRFQDSRNETNTSYPVLHVRHEQRRGRRSAPCVSCGDLFCQVRIKLSERLQVSFRMPGRDAARVLRGRRRSGAWPARPCASTRVPSTARRCSARASSRPRSSRSSACTSTSACP